jgi:hypothetical protein
MEKFLNEFETDLRVNLFPSILMYFKDFLRNWKVRSKDFWINIVPRSWSSAENSISLRGKLPMPYNVESAKWGP